MGPLFDWSHHSTPEEEADWARWHEENDEMLNEEYEAEHANDDTCDDW